MISYCAYFDNVFTYQVSISLRLNLAPLLLTQRTTQSDILQGYVTSVMDSERGVLYMERRINIYSIFQDIFK